MHIRFNTSFVILTRIPVLEIMYKTIYVQNIKFFKCSRNKNLPFQKVYMHYKNQHGVIKNQL